MAAQQPPAADDILAEVFQQLENNGNFELNFNQLIPPGILPVPFSSSASLAEVSEKAKSSSKHKKKHSKRKSAKKKKSNKEEATSTATASLGSTHTVELKKDSLHQEHLPKISKTKKSKRSHSSDKKKHSSKVQSPSRKKHKNDQNKEKIVFSNPKLKAEILEPKQNEFNDDDKYNKSSVEKRMEEMYEEYERTMNPTSDHSGIKAVSLEDYLKSKGYLMKEKESKKDTRKTSDSTEQKFDSKHSSTKPTRPLSSSSFIPRNLKITKLISSTDDSKTATNCETERKVVVENISDDEDSVMQVKAVEENSVADDAAQIQLEISPEKKKIVSNFIDSGTNDVPSAPAEVSETIESEEDFEIWTTNVYKIAPLSMSSVANLEIQTNQGSQNEPVSSKSYENFTIQTNKDTEINQISVRTFENFQIRMNKESSEIDPLSIRSDENCEIQTNNDSQSFGKYENFKIQSNKDSEIDPLPIRSEENFTVGTNKDSESISIPIGSSIENLEIKPNFYPPSVRTFENLAIQTNNVSETVLLSTRSDDNFEQLISKPIPKSIVINILTEKTKTLLAASTAATSIVNPAEEGEIVQSDFSSINSPDEIDMENETDGELKDDEKKSKKEKKKRKKHHKSEKHSKKLKKSKTSSSLWTSTKKRTDDVSEALATRFGGASSFFDGRKLSLEQEEKSHRRSTSYVGRHSHSPRPSSSRDRSRYNSISRESQINSRYYWNRRREIDFTRSRMRSRSPPEKGKYYRDHRRRSSPGADDDDDEKEINKKKLYDIARRNASAMLQQGTLQQVYNMSAQEIAKLKAGGKSVDELTDYCRKLQKKEDRFNHNSDSSSEEGLQPSADDGDLVFRHPFALNPPKNNIIFNVRNLTQIPIKTPAERAADDKTLKITFPVSSGQQHRVKEDEWVPVTPPQPSTEQTVKAPKKQKSITSLQTLAIEPAPPEILPLPPPPMPPPVDESNRVFAESSSEANIDIGEVVANRLKAIRRLYDNPNDIEALKMMHFAEENMKKWAESKNVPGAFIGGTGAICLTPDQLGPRDPKMQAWARKDQLISCKPVESRVGMSLLQKMGWKPGEGLGKNKEGSLTPLLLDVKNDRKGLVADDELKSSKIQLSASAATCKDFQGKHPVSVLMELCAKRRWNPPSFSCVETGPSHNRRFLWKVVVNGVEYQPAVPSNNKKVGKAQACQVVLQSLGQMPRDQAVSIIIG